MRQVRRASITRTTSETSINIDLVIDGSGKVEIDTGVGFFDHMLEQLGFHAGFDLKIKCEGDLHIDSHHMVEDCGLCLGEALVNCVGDKKSINRYGWCLMPMDEALVQIALDFCNRPSFCSKITCNSQKIGQFDIELVNEFFKSIANNAKMSLHIDTIKGENSHHIVEACFKGFAKALQMAIKYNNNQTIPSTKGRL